MNKHPLYKNIIIVFLSIALAVITAEISLRYLGYTPNPFAVNSAIAGNTKYSFTRPDPELGWVNKAGTPVAAEKGNAKMTILESGQRVNASAGKKNVTKRVVIVGCSITMGYGVQDEETFPYLLDQKYLDTEFENYGSGGYGTWQSYVILKRIFSSKKGLKNPDLVIYGYIPHHKDRNVVTPDWAFALTDARGHTVNPPHALYDRKDLLVTYPFSAVQVWPLEGYSALVNELHKRIRVAVLEKRREQRDPVTLRLISDMNNYVKARGAKFLVVVLNASDVKFTSAKKTRELIKDPLIGLLNEKEIDNVVCHHPEWDSNARNYLKTKGGHKLLINGNGHPVPELHKYWAGCVSEYIDKKKLLP